MIQYNPICCFILYFFIHSAVVAQNVGINTTGAAPNASSMLDVSATNKGLLIPRVSLASTTDNTTITSPATSLLVYNTNASITGSGAAGVGYYYWSGSLWVRLALSSEVVQDHDWYEVGTTNAPDAITDDMYHTGNVGIGVTDPVRPLQVFTGSQDTAVIITQTSNLSTPKVGVSLNMLDQGTGNVVAIRANMNGTNSGRRTVLEAALNNYSADRPYGSNFIFTGSGTGLETGYIYQSSSANPSGRYAFRNYVSAGTTAFSTGLLNEFLFGTNQNEMCGVCNYLNGRGNKYGVYNQSTSADSGAYYGLRNILTASGNGTVWGVSSTFSGTGNSIYFGTHSYNTNTGSGTHYGSVNWLAGSGSGIKYGAYDTISVDAGGRGFAVLAAALDTANDYAGFFRGKLSVGMDYTNNYVLPTMRGTDNQLLQTDGAGKVSWVDPATAIGSVGWLTTGNSGTDPAVNFLGTTDDKALVFRYNNLFSGVIDSSKFTTAFGYSALSNYPATGSGSTAFGYAALRYNTTGFVNTALGNSALYSNTTGYRNTAVGQAALFVNDKGNDNLAFGVGAMFNNTTASGNLAIGNFALDFQSFDNGGVPYYTGNTAIGLESLTNNNPTATFNGNRNTAVGYQSMKGNTVGAYNTSLGHQSLLSNTVGNYNTALGDIALALNTSGSENIAAGVAASYENTIGAYNISIGNNSQRLNRSSSYNVAVGTRALYTQAYNPGTVWTGANVAIGHEAMYSTNSTTNSNGIRNVGVGFQVLLYNTTGTGNTALGHQNMYNNTTGNSNTAVGDVALASNTLGSNNISVGNGSLYSNTTAGSNVAVGVDALRQQAYSNANTAYSTYNVAVGNNALYSNNPTSVNNGIFNTALGDNVLYNNSTGHRNTAIGARSMVFNTTGIWNTALGVDANRNNTIGSYNIAVGGEALISNTTADGNVALGFQTLRSQSFNNGGVVYSPGNTALGHQALFTNNPTLSTNGIRNTAAGFRSLYANSTGSSNTAVGELALNINTTGSFNTALGSRSGDWNNTGSNNTLLGYDADVVFSTLNYATAIGSGATVGCSNCLALGGNTITSRTFVGINQSTPTYSLDINQTGSVGIGLRNGATTWEIYNGSGPLFLLYGGIGVGNFNSGTGAYTASSDARLKKNIQPAKNVLDKLMQLKPKTYQYIRDEKNKTVLGLLAQEVEPYFPEFVYTQKLEEKGETEETYTLDYAGMSVVAIKAIQEQQMIIQEQQMNIQEQQKIIRKQQESLDKHEAEIGQLKELINQLSQGKK